MAPHSSTLAWKIPWMEEPPPPIALFSASYCLATTPNFQLTTPAPHLQQSFKFLWVLNWPHHFALTTLPSLGPVT